MAFRFVRLMAPTLGLLAACSGPAADQTTTQTTTSAPTPSADSVATVTVTDTPADTLPTVVVRRSISDQGAPDVFRLRVQGDSLLTAPVLLTIHSASGQELYRQQLNPGDLEGPLVYELKDGQTATPALRTAYLKRRLAHFFADSCFSSPAVKPGEAYTPGFVDQATWEDLRRPGTVEFRYVVGKEDGYRLAWSARQKRVVRFGAFGG